MAEAFPRARQFLNYRPVARWLALVGSVASGLLYVALLGMLALFVDLMVNRGAIPTFERLSLAERDYFLTQVNAPTPERKIEWAKQAESLGVKQENLVGLLNKDNPEALSEKDKATRLALLWYVTLPDMIQRSLSEDAVREVRKRLREHFELWGPSLGIFHDLEDFGALGLFTRKQTTGQHYLVRTIVRWNWMWQSNFSYLRGLFIIAILLAVIRFAALYFSETMAALAVVEAVTRMRRAVYHHTFRLGTLAFRALGPTEAVGVSTRHLEAVNDGLLAWLTIYFREPVKFGLLLIFAMLVNIWLSLAFILFALLVWLIGGQVAAYFRGKGRLATLRAANQLALIQESLMLMRLVKVYLMEQFNQTRIERQFASYARSQLRRYRGEALYWPLFLFLGLVACLVLLFVAGLVVLNDRLSVTSAAILVTALVSLYWPAIFWLECRRLIRRGRLSARVVFEFLDRPSTVGQSVEAEFLPPMTKQIEFDKVSLNEPGSGRKLLHDISLAIPAGARVALVGPEDMEKYALVYLLPRFLDPTAGEIRIDRKNVRWVTLDSLRAQIAMVMQHNLVFNDTVANNIGCGDPSFPLPRIIEAAKVAHVHQFIQKLPRGYETMIGDLGRPLNTGEMYRIALARAILRDPAVYVIEEPVNPLDDEVKGLVDDTYSRILPGRTVIFLPHRMTTIRSCDRVYLLYEGTIEAAGDHRELLGSSDLYRHLQYQEFNEFAGLLQPSLPDIDLSKTPV